jgi:hypothetical protein
VGQDRLDVMAIPSVQPLRSKCLGSLSVRWVHINALEQIRVMSGMSLCHPASLSMTTATDVNPIRWQNPMERAALATAYSINQPIIQDCWLSVVRSLK